MKNEVLTGRQKIRRYSQERGISKSRDCYAEPGIAEFIVSRLQRTLRGLVIPLKSAVGVTCDSDGENVSPIGLVIVVLAKKPLSKKIHNMNDTSRT